MDRNHKSFRFLHFLNEQILYCAHPSLVKVFVDLGLQAASVPNKIKQSMFWFARYKLHKPQYFCDEILWVCKLLVVENHAVSTLPWNNLRFTKDSARDVWPRVAFLWVTLPLTTHFCSSLTKNVSSATPDKCLSCHVPCPETFHDGVFCKSLPAQTHTLGCLVTASVNKSWIKCHKTRLLRKWHYIFRSFRLRGVLLALR